MQGTTDLLSMLYPALPGIGAVLLSLYNWYTLRQGGRIRPLKIVNYGIWAIKSNEKMVKHLFLPVILDNSAIKPALVTDIVISFQSTAGASKQIAIKRRIELNMPGNMSGKNVMEFKQAYTKELVPFYPIPVNGQEGNMVMLDCIDLEEAIVLDTDCSCTIEVSYSANKRSSISFPFKLTSQDCDKARDGIIWLRA